jgi:hypothetical protein
MTGKETIKAGIAIARSSTRFAMPDQPLNQPQIGPSDIMRA